MACPRISGAQRGGRFAADVAPWLIAGAPRPRRFHVDKLSSAHVYMRVQRGQTLADLSKEARGRAVAGDASRSAAAGAADSRRILRAEARVFSAVPRRSWRTAAS